MKNLRETTKISASWLHHSLHFALDAEKRWGRQPCQLTRSSTLGSRWIWLLPKVRIILKEWEFATSEDIQRICFTLWKQFQEDFELFFLTKSSITGEIMHHRQGDEEFTGLCKFKFHSSFSLYFFFILSHYGLQVPDRLPHKRIRPGIAKSNHFPVQADSINRWHSQGLWGPQRKGYACPFKAPTLSYI